MAKVILQKSIALSSRDFLQVDPDSVGIFQVNHSESIYPESCQLESQQYTKLSILFVYNSGKGQALFGVQL